MTAFPVSETTQKILKNFAAVADGVVLLEGTHQKTVTQSKTVFALAEFPEPWPRETGIFQLGKFLGNLSLFAKPTIDFQKNVMILSDAEKVDKSVLYCYSDPTTIMAIGDKVFPKDNPAVEFILLSSELSWAQKSAALNGLETINIIANGGKGGGVTLTAVDPKNSSSHALKMNIHPTNVTFHDETFKRTIPFRVEHLNLLLDGTYRILLSAWKYAYAMNMEIPGLNYYITEQTKD